MAPLKALEQEYPIIDSSFQNFCASRGIFSGPFFPPTFSRNYLLILKPLVYFPQKLAELGFYFSFDACPPFGCRE